MAASVAVHSYGTTLGYSATSGGSYTTVAEVVSVDDGESVGATKVTHLTSDNAAHEYIPGLADGGEVTFMCNFKKSDFAAFKGLRRTFKYWKVTDADGSTTVFYGFWTKLAKKNPDDDRITYDVTLKVSGVPTFTAAA